MPELIEKSFYGTTRDGQKIERFRLSNEQRSSVDIITYGGIITSWLCEDQHGRLDDIVLGYDNLAQYESCEIYMGCIAGRYANRIANGRFVVDGEAYQLEQNDHTHHLHGGSGGFHKRVWQGWIEEGHIPQLVLELQSADGEGGYPGNLDVQIRFSLDHNNALSIQYTAVTDKATVVNLTSHSYFNLRGHQYAGENGVLDHQLTLNAPRVLEVDGTAIPTGVLAHVDGGAFDFRQGKRLGASLHPDKPHLYDHCYAPDDSPVAALLSDPVSGRSMEVATTLPGLQLYTAGFVNDCPGREGMVYGRRGSVCLEAQGFPDAPNHAHFPQAVIRPGEIWQHQTTYRLLATSPAETDAQAL